MAIFGGYKYEERACRLESRRYGRLESLYGEGNDEALPSRSTK